MLFLVSDWNMSDFKPRDLLIQYLMSLDFLPDELTIEKVVKRAEEICKFDDTITFTMIRHPGLFGRPSGGKGIGLSALFKEKTRYLVNLNTGEWKINVLESKLEYDAWLMAVEEIEILKEAGILPSTIESKDEIESTINSALQNSRDYYYEMRDEKFHNKKYDIMVNELLDEMRKQLITEYK